MNQDNKSQVNVILAVVLSLGFMFFWNYLFPPPPPEQTRLPSNHLTASSTSTLTLSATTSHGTFEKPEIKNEEIKKHLFQFETENYSARLSNYGAGIEKFQLKTFFGNDQDGRPTKDPIQMVDGEIPSFQVIMQKSEFVSELPFHLVSQDASQGNIAYRAQTEDKLLIEKNYHLGKNNYLVESEVTLTNLSHKTLKKMPGIQVVSSFDPHASKGGLLSPPINLISTACYFNDQVERIAAQDLGQESMFEGKVSWAGIDHQFFITAVIPLDTSLAKCQFRTEGNKLFASIIFPEKILKPNESASYKFIYYLGPKDRHLLATVGHELGYAIDYKVLGVNWDIICKPMLAVLDVFYRIFGSYGIAIILLTLLVKILIFPLTQKSFSSMQKMQKLRPEMELVREKYKNDKMRVNQEVMGLYKKHGINPMGGCLPTLLQMPIYISLYRALWVAVELYHQSFLWLPDLTTKDPYYAMPLLLGVLMFIQQKITPQTMDSQQAKIMLYFMPPFFTLIMLSLPSGLVLYILVNTILGMIQQKFFIKGQSAIEPENQKKLQKKPDEAKTTDKGSKKKEMPVSSKNSSQ